MKLKIDAAIISGEFFDVELLNKLGLAALPTMGATELKVRLGGKYTYDLKLIGQNNIDDFSTGSVRALFRMVVKENQSRAYNLFKAIDVDTNLPVMVLVHTRRIFIIKGEYDEILFRNNEKHVYQGNYVENNETYHEYTIIRGTLTYGAPVDRFLATYQCLAKGLENFRDLDSTNNHRLFDVISQIDEKDPTMELIITDTRIVDGRACRVAMVVDGTAWYLTRSSILESFKYAKLNDLLHLVTTVIKPTKSVNGFDLAVTALSNPLELKYVSTTSLPHGTAREFKSPNVPSECLDHILKTIDKSNTIIGTVGKIREQKKLSPGDSGCYYLAGYGMFGRVMLTSQAQKDLLALLCADGTDIYIHDNDIKIYYSTLLDVNAIYISGKNPVSYPSSKQNTNPIQPTLNMEETSMTTTATNATINNPTAVGSEILDYLKEDLNMKVLESYLETDVKVIPGIFDGSWTLINAGDASNVVPVYESDDSNIYETLQAGSVVVTPTRTYIGTEHSAFYANTAIHFNKAPEIVEVQLPAPEYTKDQLVEKLIEKIKAGECTALELIAKLSAAH